MRSVRHTNFDVFSRRMLALTEELVTEFPMLSAGVIYRTVEAARCLTPRDGRHDEHAVTMIAEQARSDLLILAAVREPAPLRTPEVAAS